MNISSPSASKIGESGTVRVTGVDFKTAQDIVVRFAKKNVRFAIDKISIISHGVDTVSAGASIIAKEVDPEVFTRAALSTALTGANNDLTLTAVNGGAIGNEITLALVNPGTASQALGIVVDGSDIVANLATGAGTAQVETATAAGTVTLAGNAKVTVTSALLSGSPVEVAVPVALTDTANAIATAIRTALADTPAIAAKFNISGATNAVILTVKAAFVGANDATLNIAIEDDTSVGVTTAASSANTTAGVAPAITTTAAQLLAALEASEDAAALVTVANKSGNDGTGVVTALSETPLTGGLNWTVKDTLVAAADLADSDKEGLVQDLTLSATKEVIEGGNGLLLQITAGSTATADVKDMLIEYSVV